MRLGAVNFDHLLALGDDTGVLEHALGATPRRSHGYCVDDVARALVAVSREPDPEPPLARLGTCCLALVAHAQASDGRCHNRLSYTRSWEDEATLGDWWGRALWGLGTAAARHRDPWVRHDAVLCFDIGVNHRTRWPRTMAFAALGAAEILSVHPGHPAATSLIADAATTIAGPGRKPGRASWPWPEARLAYANAVLPEALIAAGDVLGNDSILATGLDLLAWLLDLETRSGHLSVTPVGGWGPGEARPGFDQQPIEAAAIADACARALSVTGDSSWAAGIDAAARWFLGDNDAGIPMVDPVTGGGFDGLEPGGRNANQGAESTLAAISTFQQAARLAPVAP